MPEEDIFMGTGGTVEEDREGNSSNLRGAKSEEGSTQGKHLAEIWMGPQANHVRTNVVLTMDVTNRLIVHGDFLGPASETLTFGFGRESPYSPDPGSNR